MNSRQCLSCLLIVFLWTQLGCSDFTASGCKKGDASATGVKMFGLVTDIDRAAYPGLKCLSWEIHGENLAMDLINFRGGCEEEWKGDDDVDGHTVTLEIEEDEGLIKEDASCGNCLYDFSFEVDDLPTNGDITIKVKMEGQSTETYTIPDERRASGIVCKLEQSHIFGICCGLHQFCSINTAQYGEAPCEDGLVCVPDEPNGGYGTCFAPCDTDTECPTKPVPTTCEDGLCDLLETF